jgi:hypothetical protein
MKLTDIEDSDQIVTKEYLDLKLDAKLGEFQASMHRDFGDFRTDLMKTVWLSQLSMAGIIVALVGIINGTTFFLLSQLLHK